jgi:hypothetical protein
MIPMFNMLRQRHVPRHIMFALGVSCLLSLIATQASAQRPRERADSVPLRADYRDIDELLGKLPRVAAPTFDEKDGVELGAIQLSCLDRLQPLRPGRSQQGRGVSADSSGGSAADTSADSTRAAATNDRGEGYFWEASYSLVARNNQTRAFWGCDDWHSAVSSTWATVYLLKSFPNSTLQELSREKLADHLGASNLAGELDFFHDAAAAMNPIPYSGQRGLFERPYGFAWLLKLYSELYTWPDSAAREWTINATPLAKWMADSLGAYFTTLPVAERDGDQSNTALSLTLALDYAEAAGNVPLRRDVLTTARRFFIADKSCKTEAEAAAGRATRNDRSKRAAGGDSTRRAARATRATRADTGYNDLSAPGAAPPPRRRRSGPGDVVSPCLTEAAVMSRVLGQTEFASWLHDFLPPLESGRFSPLTEAAGSGGAVPAGDSARLSGLSFQRAQAMERIAGALPAGDPWVTVLHRLSAIHSRRGFELMRGEVSGISWLPAYALLYIEARKGS